MIVKDLITYFEAWAPPGIAWENDNVGLQVGSPTAKIKNILLSLELNDKVLSEAINKNCNLVITHHPLIFNPIKKIDTSFDYRSKLIQKILSNKISVYSAHTNLDFTKDGVSFELARILKLKNVTFLVNQNSNQYKLVVFVPEKAITSVSTAIFKAGGGIIGEYRKCSYRLKGHGTFEGSEFADPAIGMRQTFETVEEIRLEVLVNLWDLNLVLQEMIKAHPYEEPAYDVYLLKNENVNYGFGAIGELSESIKQNEFLNYVSKILKTKALKYCNPRKNRIKKVAVCGGSGSKLINSAIALGADAFVTADIKYHDFQDAENKILLLDAGHYETEIHSLNAVARKLKILIDEKKEKVNIVKFKGSTNPIKVYNKTGVN